MIVGGMGINSRTDCRRSSALRAFVDAEFRLPADVERAGLAEGLEEAIKDDLHLALFITGDVLLTPRGEFGEFVPARHGGFPHKASGQRNPPSGTG